MDCRWAENYFSNKLTSLEWKAFNTCCIGKIVTYGELRVAIVDALAFLSIMYGAQQHETAEQDQKL